MASFQGFDQWQQRQQRARRRRRIIIVAIACVLLITTPLTIYRYSRPLPALTPQTFAASVPAQPVPISWPSQGQAAVSWDSLDTPLLFGEQKPVPTASVAKVILALTVLKQKPLKPGEPGPLLTMSTQDEAAYHDYLARDGSVIPVTAGQQISEFDALQAVMLPSANNIADSLAIWAYGSMANYRVQAQQFVKQLGMNQTTIGTDASGMAPDTTSNTQDLVLLARAAIAHPVLRSIMRQSTTNLAWVGPVRNYNTLLGSEIFGIKTGNTDEAGGCFMFAAERVMADGQKRTFVGAVMGLPNREQALASTPPLLNSLYQGFGYTTVAHKDQVLAEYQLPWAGKVQAVASSDLKVFGWLGHDQTAKLNLSPLRTPRSASQTIGNLSLGSQQINVVLATTAPAPSWWWRLKR